jgi:hypothetical protein
MLVSNNPEGLSSPGAIVAVDAKAGALAAYIHHSNHTKAPLDLFLVVKPEAGPVHVTMSGASDATGGGKRAADGPSGDWSQDPNVVVAAANTAGGQPHDRNANNVTNLSRDASSPTSIAIGQLPAWDGKGDQPLFDARFQLELSADAKVEVVAERANAAASGKAAGESAMADGNTKIEEGSSNGRAAGLYDGAKYASDDTVLVSKLPHDLKLTGSKFSGGPSPKREGAGPQVAAPSDATLQAARTKAATSVDAATVMLLDRVFRISPEWLTEKQAWDGTHLKPDALASNPDYVQLIEALQGAVTADRSDEGMKNTKAVIASHSSLGASLDAASYGTMFQLAFLVDNDTRAPANVDLTFITDIGAHATNAEGAVYRGMVTVDGVDHAINNDTAHGHPNATDLGSIGTIAADQSKYVHVSLQSPGQISAGQELEIKNK